MDIRVHGDKPSAEGRRRRLLRHPPTGWEGGERAIGRDDRAARGGRAARDRRDLLLHAPRRPGPRRLGERRRSTTSASA
ncbi:MAG: hypothetical protein R2862_02790 [Thermoanaerobaculia bacterium]